MRVCLSAPVGVCASGYCPECSYLLWPPGSPSSAALESFLPGELSSMCFCKPFLGCCSQAVKQLLDLIWASMTLLGFFSPLGKRTAGNLTQPQVPSVSADQRDQVILKTSAKLRYQAHSVSHIEQHTNSFFFPSSLFLSGLYFPILFALPSWRKYILTWQSRGIFVC